MAKTARAANRAANNGGDQDDCKCGDYEAFGHFFLNEQPKPRPAIYGDFNTAELFIPATDGLQTLWYIRARPQDD